MHVRLDHERVVETALGSLNRDTVEHRLVLVIRLVAEIAVTQERAHRLVMVREVVKTVEVAAQALLQNPQHQDPPQFHARAPDLAVGLRQDMLVQQLEYEYTVQDLLGLDEALIEELSQLLPADTS